MRCLCCGREIAENAPAEEKNTQWHKRCVKKFFGTTQLPVLDLSEEMLLRLAQETADRGFTVPGVQKKLSLHLSKEPEYRLTIVDYPAGFILKPQTEEYACLPEYEDAVMRMADTAGIRTVPHALMRTGTGHAYITRRVDRDSTGDRMQMFAMEDFCQLSGRLTEDKYKGSYERCAQIIDRYSLHTGLDLAEFYLRILFSYLTGNSDMHLKNFSLREMTPGGRDFVLSEAYDLLPVNVILPADQEETALTLHGKKRNIRRKDLLVLASHCKLSAQTAERMIRRLLAHEGKFQEIIKTSCLPEDRKEALWMLIVQRMERLRVIKDDADREAFTGSL
jgi:serine/threonine-protein kinase HipA